jgi:cytochrome P450
LRHCAAQTEDKYITNKLTQYASLFKIAEKRGRNYEKTSLMDLLIQCADISKEEIVGELATSVGVGTDTTSNTQLKFLKNAHGFFY